VITLLTSKASQDAAEQIVIPRGHMPAACRALETWATLAGLQPRQRVFCPIDQHGHLSPKRLTGHGISAIVQTCMRRLEHRRGKTRKDAKAAAALFSGHSLRTGYAVSAAAKELPSYRIQPQIRGYGAGLHPRKRPVGKDWIEGGGVLIPPGPPVRGTSKP
jgi:hypothetical protein